MNQSVLFAEHSFQVITEIKEGRGEKTRECLQPARSANRESANRETSCLPGFHGTFQRAYTRLNFHIHKLQERKTFQTLWKYLKLRFLLLQKILDFPAFGLGFVSPFELSMKTSSSLLSTALPRASLTLTLTTPLIQ